MAKKILSKVNIDEKTLKKDLFFSIMNHFFEIEPFEPVNHLL